MSEPNKNSQRDENDAGTRENSYQDWEKTRDELMETASVDYEMYPGTERDTYDFTAERLNMHTSKLVGSIMHLVQGCLGAGILCIHVGFMHGGLWTSLLATFVFGLIVSYCMMMLVQSAHKMYVRLRIPRLTYPELAEVVVATGPWKSLRRFSKNFRYIVDTTLFIEMCGTSCFYENLIAITFKQALEVVSPTMKNLNLNLRWYILIIAAPLIVLCMIRSLKYLAPFSIAVDIFIVACVVSMVFFSISEADYITDRPSWKSFHGLVRFSGVCFFSIDGVGVTLTVENNMRSPKYFSVVLQYGMAIVVISVAVTGFVGYWGWGEACRAPITIHMPPQTVLVILQFFIAIAIGVLFAVHLWVPSNIAWHYIGRNCLRNAGLLERMFRMVHVLLITCMAVTFQHMIELMIFMGYFFLAFIAFIFPAFIESLVTWREHQNGIRWGLVKNCFIMLTGVILIGAAFYSVLGP